MDSASLLRAAFGMKPKKKDLHKATARLMELLSACGVSEGKGSSRPRSCGACGSQADQAACEEEGSRDDSDFDSSVLLEAEKERAPR